LSAKVLLVALALSADPRAQLHALQARKAAEEAAARALQEREGSLLSAIDAAERSWLKADATAREAESKRTDAQWLLDEAESAEGTAQKRLDALRAELGPRLRAQARQGKLPELRLLASAASVSDLAKRRYLWRRVVQHDLALLSEGEKALDLREKARAAREREVARIAALTRDAQERREVASGRRDQHRVLLATVRSARSLHERAAGEVAAQEQKLAQFLADLPAPGGGGAPHTGFALLRGKLPLPVAGPIEARFGRVVDPRFNTVTVQNGIDIRAPAGADVRAVAPGRVAHAGWFKGYGNLVIVDQGEGYHTLVAHLASMSTGIGEEVHPGTLLGTVGDTGSLKGAYLYFEIREHGRPVDPGAWLQR
jgi:septal ring factor EnvC (AmiA/AmiB activator)